MRLSTRAQYSLRLMVELARRGDGRSPVSLAEVARRTDLSRRYLEQLVIALKSALLLRGVSGKEGGYYLARPAAQIRIGEIIEAAMGPIRIVDCVGDPRECLRSEFCECRVVYSMINRRISEVLSEFTLADLVDRQGFRRTFERLEGKRGGATAPHAPLAERKAGVGQQ